MTSREARYTVFHPGQKAESRVSAITKIEHDESKE
jgi:hypothetical protein